MTWLYGYAPRAGRLVTASLWPNSYPLRCVGLGDRDATGPDGRWELNLYPTVESGHVARIHVFTVGTWYVHVPMAEPGGAGDRYPIDVFDCLADVTALRPVPLDVGTLNMFGGRDDPHVAA